MEFQYQNMGMCIKIRRKELKMKQTELAETLGISNNHMSSIKNGHQKPSLDTLIGICNCLNVSPEYFLLGAMHLTMFRKTFLTNCVYATRKI